MPQECPAFSQDYQYAYSEYNACIECRYRHDNECRYYINATLKLSDVLTIEERLSILEDKISEVRPPDRGLLPRNSEIDQLKAGFLHLRNKINEHVDKGKKGDRI